MEEKQLRLILERPIQRLARSFAPERIVLFGSYAKGAAHPGSDIDLLVVADLPGDLVAHLRRARQLVADVFPPVDVTLCTLEEAANAGSLPSPFILSVLEHGIIVYQRTPSISVPVA